jgi:hypothetical protein
LASLEQQALLDRGLAEFGGDIDSVDGMDLVFLANPTFQRTSKYLGKVMVAVPLHRLRERHAAIHLLTELSQRLLVGGAADLEHLPFAGHRADEALVGWSGPDRFGHLGDLSFAGLQPLEVRGLHLARRTDLALLHLAAEFFDQLADGRGKDFIVENSTG